MEISESNLDVNGTQVNLGRGTIRNLSSILLKTNGMANESIWETIQEFDIPKEGLKKLNPKYQELSEIYSAIKEYRSSVKYLKELKSKLT